MRLEDLAHQRQTQTATFHLVARTQRLERLEDPFVVLLDWSLPRMGGGELLARMRADRELRTAVVFVLTTSRDPADRLAAYELNVAGYLVKSDRTEELLPALAMIAQYGRVVELP